MDPVTAIGLASAIITFVEVGTKPTRGTFEFYKSATGSTENNAQLKTLAQDLKDVTADLQIDVKGGSKHEKALLELAADCRKLSERLLSLLRELTVSGERTLQKSLKTKFKSMRKDREIQEIEARLAGYRSQLFLHLNLILREEQSATNRRLKQIQSTSQELQKQNSKQLEGLRQEIIQSTAQLLQEQNETKESDKTSYAETKDLIEGLQQTLKTLSLGMSKLPLENAILESLYYPSMYDRQSSIGAEERGTFRWIFEDEGDRSLLSDSNINSEIEEDSYISTYSRELRMDLTRLLIGDLDSTLTSEEISSAVGSGILDSGSQGHDEFVIRDNSECEYKAQVRSTFRSWLEIGDGIFHISGKAGSGKSTLMNFLCDHRGTKDLLLKWVGGKKLLFPQEWKRLQRQETLVKGALLSDSAIKQAFETLTRQEEMPNRRFCFFIDGLDECEGDSRDHVELAESLLWWSNHADIKICASSRPHNEFIHVFSNSVDRRMHLHELTRRDLHLFTRRAIESDRNFQHVKKDYLRLVTKIVQMSDGVFLWARLVVRSLSAGMLRYDTISVLEEKLHHVPKDIDHLYRSLFESMDKQDRTRAMKMLHLAAHNPWDTPLNAIDFAWIDDLNDPHFPPTDGIKPSSWMKPRDMVIKVGRQLAGITKGLLDVKYSQSHKKSDDKEAADDFYYVTRPSVQFLHRSVRDYVLTSMIDEDLSIQYEEMTSAESYIRLWIAEMTLLHKSHRASQWEEAISHDISKLFQEEIPLHLLDSIRLLTTSSFRHRGGHCYSSSTRFAHISLLMGASPSRYSNVVPDNFELSFVHAAAYTSQTRYVARELGEPSTLSIETNGKDLNLLLSAALGHKKDMVDFLMSKGYSAKENVLLRGITPAYFDQYYFPIWMILITLQVHLGLNSGYADPDGWEIIGLLLVQCGKDARNCNFVFSASRSDELEIVGLREMIQILNPHNKEALLQQLDDRSLGRLSTVWTSILSGLWAKQLNENTEKYNAYVKDFYTKGRKSSPIKWNGKSLICTSSGDLVLPSEFAARPF